MELFHMVFDKGCFQRIAGAMDGTVDIFRPVPAERTGSADFVKTVGNIQICMYESSPKVHGFYRPPTLTSLLPFPPGQIP